MRTNVYMLVGIIVWGTISGVIFYICSSFKNQSLLSYIVGSVFVCALYTLAVVSAFRLKPKRSGRAFFYPVIPMVIFDTLALMLG